MMFNEELRAILRRNLFSMDEGDVGQKLADDMNELLTDLKIAENAQPEDVALYA